MPNCKSCKSNEVKKFGKTANNKQRYRCQRCGKTFIDEITAAEKPPTLLEEIKAAIPYGQNPETIEDMIADIALFVVEGKIDPANLSEGIKHYLPSIRRKYRAGSNISLEQPIGESITLQDVITKNAPLPKHSCPNCGGKVKAGRTYCKSSCALVYAVRQRKKADPKEVEYLNKSRWLSRDEIAASLATTRACINNIITRYKLSRFLPETCIRPKCGKPVFRFRNAWGNRVGNLCLEHKKEKQRFYQQRIRERHKKNLTPENRKELARKASLARWSKTKWKDKTTRSQFGKEVQSHRSYQRKNGLPQR